eukprot:CAMPEP_0170138068 /NCGR_PEP_ID=MMETSP0033_2-20121228/4648_1 /TAXON_ID=195969 /ORGANISM="Dolichomastix tenuilepis, Strain CCMP3274" /LENGTH=321 /DNA_ID=CAMNT_0010374031 /DNA_START=135 /DNA_END=1100 /DNA_ORIENTATION=+
MPWSSAEEEALIGVSLTANVLSLCGCIVIIGNGVLQPSLRPIFSYQLVACLGAAEAVFAVGCLFGNAGAGHSHDSPPPLCLLQAVMLQFGSLSASFWTAAIAHTLWRTVVHRDTTVGSLARRYHIAIWSVAAFFTLLPLALGTFGDSGLCRCFFVHVSEDETRQYDLYASVRWIFQYIPIWLVLLFELSVYVAIGRSLWGVIALARTLEPGPSHEVVGRLSELIMRLALYPLVNLACASPATLNRIWTLSGAQQSFPLAFLHILAKGLQGALHAAVFLLAHPKRRELNALVEHNCGGLCGLRSAFHEIQDEDEMDPGGVQL